jgi:predicted dehydrogenase
MGNQGHTYGGLRLIQEWYQAGILGEILEVHHWTNRPFWPQGALHRRPEAIPATLDYDLWLGIAPKKPYSSDVLPFNWRGWRDYGCGSIGDMACHIMDASYTGLGLDFPVWVESDGTHYNHNTFPAAATTKMYFQPEGKPGFAVNWYEGGPKPSNVRDVPGNFFGRGQENQNGSLIVGTEATLLSDTYAESVRIIPGGKFNELKPKLPPKTLPRIKGGPQKEFADAIRAGRQPGSNFDYAARFTEVALLGNVALFAGERITYNPERMLVTNNWEANKHLESLYDYNEEFLPG